jgi:methyl-accepting chemotaxis protein
VQALSNIRLGVRLGAAFGLLVMALAAVALTGVLAMRSLSDQTTTLADREVPALSNVLSAGRLAQTNATLTTTHLYIEDGDLSAQDATAKRIAGNRAAIDEHLATAERALAHPDVRRAFDAFKAAREKYVAAFEPTLALSREETVKAVEERDGSRNAYLERVAPALETMSVRLGEVEKILIEDTEDAGHEAEAGAASGERTILAVGLFAVLLAVGLAVFITRSVTRPVARILVALTALQERAIAGLQNGLKALAGGDLTVAVDRETPAIGITSTDEIGQVARTVDEIGEATIASVDQYNATRGALSDIVGQISGTAGSLSAASQQMASTSDEAGRAVGEIAHAVGDVAQGAERQVRMVESTKQVSEEIVSATATSAQNAERTSDAAEQARSAAGEGSEAVTQATAAMRAVRDSSGEATTAIRQLGSKSEQIGGIVSTITGIAEQTNLLALNAAIEAARAGEQGRGFAVVAEEVRKLAEESQTAAATIAGLIEEIQAETGRAVEVVETGGRATEEGVATVERVHESFTVIGSSIEDVHARVSEISAAIGQIASSSERMQSDMAEVAAVAEESSASAEQVSASTQQTSASTQEIAASAQELARNAEELEQLVGRFTLA